MKLLIPILFLISCSVKNDPSLVDEFVHGEIQTRKQIIEQAGSEWGVRFQLEVSKNVSNKNRIIFTDTCQEKSINGVRVSCIKLLLNENTVGGCSYKPGKSIIFIRRTYFQTVDRENKIALLAHEIGHCMGLEHSENHEDIMYNVIHLGNLKPRQNEIALLDSMHQDGELFKFYLSEEY